MEDRSRGTPEGAATQQEHGSNPDVKGSLAPSRSPSYSPSLASVGSKGSRHRTASPSRSRSRSRSRSQSRSRSRSLSRSISPQRGPGDEGRSSRAIDGRSASPASHERRRSDGGNTQQRRHPDTQDANDDRDAPSIEVRGLPKLVTEKHLAHIFGAYGRVDDIIVPTFARSGENRGRAHIVYRSVRQAMDAVEHMHGGQIDGVIISVMQRHVPRSRPDRAHEARDRRDDVRKYGPRHRRSVAAGSSERYDRRGPRPHSQRHGSGDEPNYGKDYDNGHAHRSRDHNRYGEREQNPRDRRPPPPGRFDTGMPDTRMHPSRQQLNNMEIDVDTHRSHSDADYRRQGTRDRSMSYSRSPDAYR